MVCHFGGFLSRVECLVTLAGGDSGVGGGVEASGGSSGRARVVLARGVGGGGGILSWGSPVVAVVWSPAGGGSPGDAVTTGVVGCSGSGVGAGSVVSCTGGGSVGGSFPGSGVGVGL